MSLGAISNVVAAGDDYGNLYVWKDPESVKDNIGVNIPAHSSPVQKIEFTTDDCYLVSAGMTDEVICQWAISPIEEVELESGPLTGAKPNFEERKVSEFQNAHD